MPPAYRFADEVLLRTKEMTALQRPSSRDYKSVVNWFEGHHPLVQDEANYIRRKEDMITLRHGRECAGFDSLVERTLSRIDRVLYKAVGCRWIRV